MIVALLCLIGAVVVTGAVWNGIEYVREKRHPFQYKQVTISELRRHIAEVHQRGLYGSQLVIAAEEDGRAIRFRKTYPHRSSNIEFRLIVDGVTALDPAAQDHIESLRKIGVPATIGVTGRQGGRGLLVCNCDAGVDVAWAAAQHVFQNVYGLPPDSTFRVHVRGAISDLELTIDGMASPAGLWRLQTSGSIPRGLPYKHWQTRSTEPAKRVGYFIGRIVRFLLRGR